MSVPRQDILSSIDRELEYYRRRNHWLFQYSLISIPVLFGFQFEKAGFLGNPLLESGIFTGIYLLVMVSCVKMQNAMKERIYSLFRTREQLLSEEATAILVKGGDGREKAAPSDAEKETPSFYTKPEASKNNPSKIFVTLIGLFGLIAIIATWVNYFWSYPASN